MIRRGSLLLLVGCVQTSSLPDVGDCAVYPGGVYEYGQIGIGACLAGPVDLEWRDERTLLVANANPYLDFTGGSVLALDFSALDLGVRENLVSTVAVGALDLPSFTGDMAPAGETLLVTNRLSAEARTRETDDHLYFVDAADPSALSLDTSLGGAEGRLAIGYDPNTVLHDDATGYAFVINRTAHEVAMVDIGQAPATILAPGGPARTLEAPFEDIDASGSTASFVLLDTVDTESIVGHDWSLSWSVASVRLWVPEADGLRRVEGNGEALWQDAPGELDLDVTTTDAVTELLDPTFGYGFDGYGLTVGRIFFMSDGYLRDAQTYDNVAWQFTTTAYLGPDEALGEAVIGGPDPVVVDGLWYLYYDGGYGDDQSIRLATSLDGTTFSRAGQVLPADGLPVPEGESWEDPFVFGDVWSDQWRMYFTVVRGDTWSIGQAVSGDLVTWTEVGERFTPDGGAASPAVGWYGGAFHLFYVDQASPPVLWEATSLDGTFWTPAAPLRTIEGSKDPRPRIAFDAVSEGTFTAEDEAGRDLGRAILPGEAITNADSGWALQVAVGHRLDPSAIGTSAALGAQVDSVIAGAVEGEPEVAWLSTWDETGVGRIARGTIEDGKVVPSGTVLEGSSAGAWGIDGVDAPVVIEDGGGYVMFFRGLAAGIGSIGRATSSDGVSWTVDAAAVLTPVEDWEAVSVTPGSAWIGEDGLVHLLYTAYDGSRWRIAEATAATGGGPFTRLPGAEQPWSMDVGAPGDWNDGGVAWPTLSQDGDVQHLWFAGYSGEFWSLGYASRTDQGEWEPSLDPGGNPRPVMSPGPGMFGVDGLVRPVALDGAEGRDGAWTLWYSGIDEGVVRSGRAITGEPDRLFPDPLLPSLADTWGFLHVPENEGDAVSLDVEVGGTGYSALGCTGLAHDELRGFLYVTCREVGFLYVLDVRDDSAGDFQDLNYLAVESVVPIGSASGGGLRSALLDPVEPWLWTLARAPEALVAVNLDEVEDNASLEATTGNLVALLPLDTAGRDVAASSQTEVGPGQIALHPNGRHLFVTNVNDNSLACFDLELGAPATWIGDVANVGENPYALTLTADGRYAIVAAYLGEVDGAHTSSRLYVVGADPDEPDFLQVVTRVVNR